MTTYFMGARYSATPIVATLATLCALLVGGAGAALAQGLPLPIEGPDGAPPAAPVDPGGFGRFTWGSSVEAVREIEPDIAAHAGAEAVTVEAEALGRIHADEKRKAKATGRQAWKAFRSRPVPQPRLAAYRFWLDLGGLPGRVELRFVDDRLYAAVVRVLYRAKDKPKAARILDGLMSKYGQPLDPPTGMAPVAERPRLDFEIPGGRLQVLRRRVEPGDARGMLRLHYREAALSEGVERYLQGLRGRLASLSVAPDPAPTDRPDAEDTPRADPLLQHL